jgi:hypothetical protein
MKETPQLVNKYGAARLLGCSDVQIVKAVEEDLIRCAWIFNQDGMLVRRPDGTKTRSGQGLHFFIDELIQYQTIRRGKPWYDFQQPVRLYNQPELYSSRGAALKRNVSMVRIVQFVKEKRLPAYMYDYNKKSPAYGHLIEKTDSNTTMHGMVSMYHASDIDKLEILPARQEAPATTNFKKYLKKYYREKVVPKRQQQGPGITPYQMNLLARMAEEGKMLTKKGKLTYLDDEVVKIFTIRSLEGKHFIEETEEGYVLTPTGEALLQKPKTT